ncbi:hypothetical protein ABH908_000272 [Pseudomonas frederiksbergensis]|uniref:hypothetical protein n=1 Tax=Pseudomonas TaxID=286 RepID=UPI003D194EEC
MRRNIRDLDHVGPFVEKLNSAISARHVLLHELIEQLTFSHEKLLQSAEALIAQLDMFPANHDGEIHSIVWRWRPHSMAAKVRSVEVLLCIDDRSKAQRVQRMISLREHSIRVGLLAPSMGKRKAAHFSKGLDKFLVQADRAVRWASAGDQPSILNQAGARSGLLNWIEGVCMTCENVGKRVAGIAERFLDLDAELNALTFEFNEARQPVRFHSIICRRDVLASDLLAPSAPRFRVVTFYDRRSGKRSSRDVQSYKMQMATSRVTGDLRRLLDREPTKAEVESRRAEQRMRRPSAMITAELISHCKLGKHSAGILRLQKKIADAMGEWEAQRAFLQALL